MAKGTVTLRVHDGEWVADWAGTTDADRIRGLFGTAILPTPFRAEIDGEEVRATIAGLNPGYTVQVIR